MARVFCPSEDRSWRHVPVYRGRPLSYVLWNPEARINKVLGDAVRTLSGRRPLDAIDNALYLCLLSHISNATCCNRCEAMQFSIVSYRGYDPEYRPKVLFASLVHRV